MRPQELADEIWKNGLTKNEKRRMIIKSLDKRECQPKKLLSIEKKFLTMRLRFGILNKLLLREAARVEKDWKETKKVLDKLKTT